MQKTNTAEMYGTIIGFVETSNYRKTEEPYLRQQMTFAKNRWCVSCCHPCGAGGNPCFNVGPQPSIFAQADLEGLGEGWVGEYDTEKRRVADVGHVQNFSGAYYGRLSRHC